MAKEAVKDAGAQVDTGKLKALQATIDNTERFKVSNQKIKTIRRKSYGLPDGPCKQRSTRLKKTMGKARS